MPRLLAIEWDSSEARVVVAQTRGGSLELQQTLSIELTSCRTQPAREWGRHIAAALTAAGVAPGEALVAVGRGSIELRFLTVPPVPITELPDLVRFQAARQFSQLHEGGQIDFIPLLSSGDPPTMVLAASISAEAMRFVQDVCHAAGLSPQHLALRPFAVAPLLPATLPADRGVLLIDLLAEEADLSVMVGRQAIFPRTVRLGVHADPKEQADAVLMEARRTIAAARNQVSVQEVTRLVICGKRNEFRLLAETLERELKLPLDFVDPFDVPTLAGDFRGERSGRFAPLVGMLLHAARGEAQEIDFLAPRKRPIPPDYSRTWMLAGIAAACIVFTLGISIWWQLADLAAETADAQDKARQLEKTLKSSRGTLEHVKLLDEFAMGQIAWTEEIRALASEMPPAERIVLRSLKGNANKAGGLMTLAGSAQESSDITALESSLRDEIHRVTRDNSQQLPDQKSYSWQFQETVNVAGNAAPRRAAAPPQVKP